MAYQDLFILGATGKVGGELIRQVYECGDRDPKHENPTRIVGLASSKAFWYDPEGFTRDGCDNITQRKTLDVGLFPYNSTDDILGTVLEPEGSQLIFVDVTADKDNMLSFHKKVITQTKFGLVTANKNPLAFSDYETFRDLTKNPRRYGFSCSVMAGAGVVPELQDTIDTGDNVRGLEGCFSGTLGFLSSGLQNFAETMETAVANGYTEPDPRDDLNGVDVARKLLILARSAGYAVNYEDINLSPFVPEEYLKWDGDLKDSSQLKLYLEKLSELDGYFKKKFEEAGERDEVLKYVANMEVPIEGLPILTVGLQAVPKDSPLGLLRGTANKAILTTDSYNDSVSCPFELQAPGAGLEVTARNIRKNLLRLINERRVA